MIENIPHPRKECVPLAVGLAWGNDGAIYQEKLDGVFHVMRPHRDCALAGELLAQGHQRGGEFIAWDCLEFFGQDTRTWRADERLQAMEMLCRQFSIATVPQAYGGGKLLADVLARGGEGIVRKLPHATYYDAMTACKRLQTWRCVVLASAGGCSVDLADADTGEARGRVALRGGKADQVRPGSIIKVEGLGLHVSGCIRDPRPCKDTADSWLISY